MPKRQRIGAATGILAPIIAFTCILSAISSYSQFSWTNNALSDLGVVSGVTGPLFNFGLVFCGLFGFIFALFGLLGFFGKNWFGRIGTVVFAVATLMLISIGIFNESFSPTHFLVSVSFFVTLPISLFIITGAFVFGQRVKMALFTRLTAVATATPWILYFAVHYVPGEAIPEFISGLAGAIWIIVIGYKIIICENQPKSSFPNNK